MKQTISIDELKNLIDTNANFVLIDVRTKEELSHGMIPKAKNIPLHEIEQSISLSDEQFQEKYGFSKPKKQDKIVFYCRTGSRSQLATEIATKGGFENAKNFHGSVWAWSDIDPKVHKYF